MDDHSKSHRYELFGEQYARLGFADTYYLGFRDIHQLISEYQISVGLALDHGCGGGRAIRFLKRIGFRTIGVDRNAEMVKRALGRILQGIIAQCRQIP